MLPEFLFMATNITFLAKLQRFDGPHFLHDLLDQTTQS